MIDMPLLHDRTRAYWETLEADKFVGAVFYGPLRAQINDLHTRVSLYTGILHRSMNGSILRLSAPPAGGPTSVVRVRDLFKHMRACMADASDIINGESATLKITAHTHEAYILLTVNELHRYLSNIERWSTHLLNDTLANSVALPELGNTYAHNIARELLDHLEAIYSLLEFSLHYAELSNNRRLHSATV
jgi:hypothetical protein